MWNQAKQFVGPALAGALLGFLLMPVSLVWSFLAGAMIVIAARRYAVPATAAVYCEKKVAEGNAGVVCNGELALSRRKLQ